MATNGKKDFRFGIDASANGLDLNVLLIDSPSSTYFMRLENDAKHLELNSGDILQINRSLSPKLNDICVVYEAGEAEMKVVRWRDHTKNTQLWGVIETVIRIFR